MKTLQALFTGLIAGLLPMAAMAQQQQLAFPGAEGYGAYASGGRGGEVYHVTTLNDSGAGSFRDAVSQPGRTVVFDLGGVIHLKSRVDVSSRITIAGQTAPGDGITVYGYPVAFSHGNDIIVRYMRFHGSIDMPRGACVVNVDSAKNVILDHISITWGRWDDLHIKHSSDVTLQYCLIGESIAPQRFGALIEEPVHLTIHHCLWIDNDSRNPKAKAGIEYINNVVYNWGKSGFVGGHPARDHYQDIINNYFIAGPTSPAGSFLAMFTASDHVFQQGNYVDTNKNGRLDGRLITDEDFTRFPATMQPAKQNQSPVPVTTDDAVAACGKVLAKVGASLHRDATDTRLISYLKSLGKEGMIIQTEVTVGGQKPVKSGKAPVDANKDGIPDSWAAAHKDMPATGVYTPLEVYLNSLVPAAKPDIR